MPFVLNPLTGLLDRVNRVIKIFDAVVDITGGGDYTTVEAAVDAGHRTIFIKSGTYPFDNLLITKSGTILIGESKIDTILDAGGFNVHISDDGVSVINDVEIRNLSLINYDGGVSPEGIIQPSEFTSGATGWIIDNCIFSGNATNLGADIHVKGSNMTITNNIFKSSIGINFTAGTGDTIISGNYFFDSRIKTTGGAIGVSTASLFIKGNYFTFASAVAPSINILASRCMISGNIFGSANDVTQKGSMDIGGVENVITGNVINRTHDTLPGIDLTGADNNVVSNNLIQNAGTDGILLAADADANVITGNRITGSGGYGVNISASTVDDTILSQNSLAGNTTAAFQDLGTNSQIGLNVTS